MAEDSLSRQFRVSRWLWFAIGLCVPISLFAVRQLGWSANVVAASDFAFIMGVCALVSLTYRFHRNANVCLFAHVINQMVVASFVVGFLSYVCAALDRPLLDDAFIRADRLLGFDWQAYVAWVNERPWLGMAMTAAYRSYGIQMVVLICMLFAYKHSAHAQRVVIVFFVSAMVSNIVSALFPAVAGYVHYNMHSNELTNLHPAAARLHEAVFNNIRSGNLHEISFPMVGIITFPSFHSVLAVMFIYACLPLQRLSLLLVPFNILMLFSIPVDGGHYLVDVLAGVAIALCSIQLSRRILPPTS